MSLRYEIAKIITPTGYTGFEKADRVLALLREGPWFDEAVERMAEALLRLPLVPTRKKPHLLKRCSDLLLAALGEET